jgi:hypothetical protein
MRQDFRDERPQRAAGEHARRDAAEQAEIVGQDFEHVAKTVAPPEPAWR